MKEIVTTSANFMAVINNGKLDPQIELGITVSEVQYSLDFQGVAKSRSYETLRFSIDPDSLRKMADGLYQFADQCQDEFQKAIGGEQ